MNRVMVFIDGMNLYHSLKDHGIRTDIDFYKFSLKLAGDDRLIRTYYYNAPYDQKHEPKRYGDQQRFFGILHRTPYLTLKLGRLIPRAWTYIQKGVDTRLSTDILTNAFKGNYEVAVLVSGDGDFEPVLEGVKEAGKNIVIATFDIGQSYALFKAADDPDLPGFMRTGMNPVPTGSISM